MLLAPPTSPNIPSCPQVTGLACPAGPCPGLSNPAICRHLESLMAWRSLGSEEQAARLFRPRPALDPALRDAVNACPDRGPVLPISLQDDCGCRGRERSECRAGKGEVAGRVTL